MAEQLAGAKPTSQFGRALGELGVALIPAHSPQAKGRIELFKTFQDRVLKEMRLARVSTRDAANQFLATYLPTYNRRFMVAPAQAADLHRPRSAARRLEPILCLKTTRLVPLHWTVAHHGQLYHINQPVQTTQVIVEDPLDGTLRIRHQGQLLRYRVIPERPKKMVAVPRIRAFHRPVKPPATHLRQKPLLPECRTQTAPPRM